jgi:predicted MFS family arabinose efflux permease
MVDTKTSATGTLPPDRRSLRSNGDRFNVGGPSGPLLLLAGLNAADEFDRIAFAALAPEIRNAFELTDGQVQLLNIIPAIMVLLAAGVIGRLIDRYSRVLISVVCAVAWGTCSFLTGLAPTVAVLLIIRIIGGIGRTANEIVHPSLLADKYAPRHHPRVFLIHRMANPLAQVSGVLSGFIAKHHGWTWAFYLLALPTFLMAIALWRMPDPPRRAVEGERRELSLRDAFGDLTKVRSLRRIWGVAFMLSIASFGMFVLISIYFEKQFGYDAQGRGFVQFIVGTGWTLGVIVGGRVAEKYSSEGTAHKLVLICAVSFLLFTFGGVALSVVHISWLAIAATFVLAIGNGVWQSPYFTAVAAIAPPGLSGQAYASSVIFYALGAVGSIGVTVVSDSYGTRVAFLVIALAGFVAAVVARSAAPLIRNDLNAA